MAKGKRGKRRTLKKKIRLIRTRFKWLMIAFYLLALALIAYVVWTEVTALPTWIIIVIAVALIIITTTLGAVRIKTKALTKKVMNRI